MPLLRREAEPIRETPLGEGAVPYPAYLAALHASGFDGYLTIEREVGRHPFDDIQAAVRFLHPLINGVGATLLKKGAPPALRAPQPRLCRVAHMFALHPPS